MDDFLQDFYQAGFFDTYVTKATLTTQMIAGVLIPLFAVITLGWNFVMTFIKNFPERPKFFEWSEIARVMVLIGLVSLYRPLIGSVATLANALNRSTVPSSALVSQSIDSFEEHLKDQVAPPGSTGSTKPVNPDPNMQVKPLPQTESPEVNFSWSDFLSSPFNVIIAILQGIVVVILAVVGIVIKLAAQVLAKIMYALGPLAIAFSILPNFRDRLVSWFNSYTNLLLVATTLNIIDMIVMGSFWGAAQGDISTYQPLSVLLIDCVVIIVYCFAFWLTSKWCGSNDAGKVLTSGIQTATAMLGNYLGGKFGGGGGGTNLGSAAGDAAKKGFESAIDTGKNAMQQ